MRYALAVAILLLPSISWGAALKSDDYSMCLLDAAKRLDDGLSDAASVAASLKLICLPKYYAMQHANGIDEALDKLERADKVKYLEWKKKLEEMQLEAAIGAVLAERKERQ